MAIDDQLGTDADAAAGAAGTGADPARVGAGERTVPGPEPRLAASQQRATMPTVALFVGLTALSALIFWPAIRTGFFIDDFGYLGVTQQDRWWTSPMLRDLSAQVLRPVTVIAIGVQQALFGYDALRFHLVALGLLTASGVLLHQVARRLGVGAFGAGAAAAVFMLHSTHGWALAWTASTSSLWVVTIALAMLLVVAAPELTRRRQVAACVLLVVALLTREIAIMLPFVAIAVRWAFVEGGARTRLRRAVRECSPFLVVLGVFLAARVGAAVYARSQPTDDRLIPILDLTSFSKAWPMVPDHLYTVSVLPTSPFDASLAGSGDQGFVFPAPVLVVAALVWVAVLVLVVREARAGRFAAPIGLAWFLLAVIPPVFLQPEIAYGNYADLALPGFALAIGAGVGSLVAGRSKGLRVGVAVVGIAVLAVVGHLGGTTLFDPPPPPVQRARQLEAQMLRDYPDPPTGSTVVVRNSIPEDQLWTSNGDQFRVMYGDPTLQVVFESPAP